MAASSGRGRRARRPRRRASNDRGPPGGRDRQLVRRRRLV